MNALKLHIDEFDDENFQLFAIHTQLEDYRLAYFINKNIGINLSKSKNEILVKNNKVEASFSRFFYEDLKKDVNWDLIKNKSHIYNQQANSQDLFGEVNAKFSTNIYLLPEYKKVDYFLKIDTNDGSIKNIEILNFINTIDHISTVYKVDLENLKSKNNLIF
jgi:hypothetical protein